MPTGKERRKYKRIPIDGSSMICRKSVVHKIDISIIRDISEGGVSFSIRNDLEAGSTIHYKFVLPETRGKVIEGVGELVWKKSTKAGEENRLFWYGLKFQNISVEDKKAIKEYISKTPKD